MIYDVVIWHCKNQLQLYSINPIHELQSVQALYKHCRVGIYSHLLVLHTCLTVYTCQITTIYPTSPNKDPGNKIIYKDANPHNLIRFLNDTLKLYWRFYISYQCYSAGVQSGDKRLNMEQKLNCYICICGLINARHSS